MEEECNFRKPLSLGDLSILHVEMEAFTKFADIKFFCDIISIQKEDYSIFDYDHAIRHICSNPNVTERSDKMIAVSKKLIYIGRWSCEFHSLINFLESKTQNTKVSEDDSEMLKKN